jgi:hypothetical protein
MKLRVTPTCSFSLLLPFSLGPDMLVVSLFCNALNPYNICGSHCGEGVCVPGSNAVWTYRHIPTLRCKILPPSSGTNLRSGIHPRQTTRHFQLRSSLSINSQLTVACDTVCAGQYNNYGDTKCFWRVISIRWHRMAVTSDDIRESHQSPLKFKELSWRTVPGQKPYGVSHKYARCWLSYYSN